MNKFGIKGRIKRLSESTRQLITFNEDKIQINTFCYQWGNIVVSFSVVLVSVFFILLLIVSSYKNYFSILFSQFLFWGIFFVFIIEVFLSYIRIVRVIDLKEKCFFTELKIFGFHLFDIKKMNKETLIGVANNIIPIMDQRNYNKDYINIETDFVHRHLVSLLIDGENIYDIIELDTSDDGYNDSVKLTNLISEVLEIKSFIIEDKYRLKSVYKDDDYTIEKEEIIKEQKTDNRLNIALIILSSLLIISAIFYFFPKYGVIIVLLTFLISMILVSIWGLVDNLLSL